MFLSDEMWGRWSLSNNNRFCHKQLKQFYETSVHLQNETNKKKTYSCIFHGYQAAWFRCRLLSWDWLPSMMYDRDNVNIISYASTACFMMLGQWLLLANNSVNQPVQTHLSCLTKAINSIQSQNQLIGTVRFHTVSVVSHNSCCHVVTFCNDWVN